MVVAGSPGEGQQLHAEEEAKLTNPEAKAEREASGTKFEKLNNEQARQEDESAFPSLISDRAGGPPALPAGQSITGYPSANAAQIDLGNGESGIVESATPIALETSESKWNPINLGLSESGNAFVPTNPLTDVRIPKLLAEGISAPASSVSITPVNEQGEPLDGSSGSIDGATIFYSNTETDTDMVAKPSTFGFEISTLLRSIESPEQLFFRVSLPKGASLEQAKNGSGSVQIVKEGVVIAVIPTPTAQDANGTVVPVRMTISGSVLSVDVNHRSASYAYPITVDPEFVGIVEDTFPNWHYTESPGGGYSGNKEYEGLEIEHSYSSFPSGDHASWAMQTNGYTKIYKIETETTETGSTVSYGEPGEEDQDIRSWIQVESSSRGLEKEITISGLHKAGEIHGVDECIDGSYPCTGEYVGNHNAVAVSVTTTIAGTNFFGLVLHSADVYLDQEKGLHTTVSYGTPAEVDGTTNVFHGSGAWMGPHSGAFEFTASDLGLGVAASGVAFEGTERWEQWIGSGWAKEPFCKELQCSATESEAYTYNSLIGQHEGLLGKEGNKGKHLPDGEDKIRVAGTSFMNYSNSAEYGEGLATLKVDSKSPYNITLTGLPTKEGTLELGEVEGHVKAEAKDGEGSTPSSGVKSIELYVDGRETGQATGYCTPGPCTGSGEWSLNGIELGAGNHNLEVKATDNADNVETKYYALDVHAASPVVLGPGSVNPESGDFALEAADVNASGSLETLGLRRHYDSRNPKEGEEEPLGPQWTMSVGSLARLEVLPDGSVEVVGPNGLTHFALKSGGGFEAPTGDSTLTLEAVTNEKKEVTEYLLKNLAKNTTTAFTLPSGSESWMPTISKGPVATDTMSDEYKTVEPSAGKKIIETTLELAPHPSATCAAKELKELKESTKGCRALEFIYAENTKEHIGENKSEWGEYKDHLQEVILIAYNPATKKMVKTPVAAYEYDKQGRLRAEWNPEISPALKTIYGYDAEGYITALTPPGQETWAFIYGTTAGDSSTGRLLKVTRATAGASLWKGEMPMNTEAPRLSGTPEVGVMMSVSTGTWSNEPVAYSYQWEDCNTTGGECTPIDGATNGNYRPSYKDLNHDLVAVVTATNGGGSTTASAHILLGVKTISESSLPSGSGPLRIASGADNNLWFTDNASSKIGKLAASGTVTEYALPSGSGPWGVTTGSDTNTWFTDGATSKIGKITTAGAITEYALPSGSQPVGITSGGDGNLWFADYGTNKIGKITTAGALTEYALPAGSDPYEITPGSDGNLWFTNSGTNKIGKITTAGVITEFALPAGSSPHAITTGSDGNLWFAEYGTSKIGKITTAGAITEYALPNGSGPYGITAGSDKNLWFTNYNTNKVGKITTAGAVSEYEIPEGDGPAGIATGPDANIWLVDYNASKIGKLVISGAEIAEKSLPSGSGPLRIATGSDHNLWFTDDGTGKIGRVTTAGTVTEYGLPGGSSPWGITSGPDKNLWFTDYASNKVGKITTAGAVTEYAVPSGSSPSGITSGPDGNLWFTDYGASKIGKITTSGAVTEYTLPAGSKPYEIASGSDGNLWFTDSGTAKIGKITTSGTITEYALPSGSIPEGIASGPDGNLWFAENGTSKIGKITTAGVITEYSLSSGSGPYNVIAGSEKNLWFTNLNTNKVGQITTSGAITEYGVPAGSQPAGLALGPDNNIWFVNYNASKIGKVAISGTEIAESSLPSGSGPLRITSGSDNNLWFTEDSTSKIGKITASGTVTEYGLPTGSYPWGITGGPDSNTWFTDDISSKIGKITTSGTVTEYALPSGSSPEGIASGPDGNLWFTDYSTNKIGKITTAGAITEYALPAGSGPYDITAGADGDLWFTDGGTAKIGRITTAGVITEYALPTGSSPHGITAGSDGNLWFDDYGTSKIGKITTSGTITEFALPSGSGPYEIAAGADKNLWFTDYTSNKIGKITTSGTITEYGVAGGNGPAGITSGPDDNIWLVDYNASKIEKVTLSVTESEAVAPQAGTTIEYNVPVSGNGAPHAMGSKELGEWAQKDDPEYATAIFPPDEPQSWPATDYKRATVFYMDSEAHRVNVAAPSGGISTSEYNETNNVTRTLSADDRVKALTEGCKSEKECKSAETATLLDTKSKFNGETKEEQTKEIGEKHYEPGSRLLETRGPQHAVKLASGAEVEARNHVQYHYDQGAPEGKEVYDLVTEQTEGAEYEGKEADARTTKTSYSGQSNLGWTLRAPTSVTKEPGGVNLTTTTVYEENAKKESTGKVVETQSPAATGKDAAVPPAYSLAFGAKGTAGGQFEGLEQDAIDSHGDVWVADYANHRIQEFSSTGTFMLAVGWGVKDGKAEAETCTSSCKAGISGLGNGQFEGPYGVAVNQSIGNVYVADYLGDRVEELSSTGAFVASFGAKGTGGAQFSSPEGLAIDSSGDVWVADSANNRIQELSSSGTFMLAVGWGVKNGKAEAETCTSSCVAGVSGSGNGQLAAPSGIAFSGSNVYVSDYGNNRVDEFTNAGAYVSKFGSKGTGTLQFEGPSGIASEATSGDLYIADSGNGRVQKITTAGASVTAFGSKGSGNGQLVLPVGIAANSSGDVYVGDHSSNRVEEWVPAITGNESAHNTRTIYYTAKTEAEVSACREHPEWVGLPCETKPVAQPGTTGLPELPVTRIEYNIWDQAETVTEMFGATERKKKTTFDGAGRPITSEVTSSIDTALPKVTDKYNTTNGTLEKQETTVGEKTKTITSLANTLGEMTSYTDAAGVTTSYEYEKEKDARLIKTSYILGKEGFKQTYGYDETTGEMTELLDAAEKGSAAGKFTATYDIEGAMHTESYPNGMTATYTHNQIGEATGLEYVKTTHCTEKCTWFKDAVVPSIHGELLSQTSTLSHESYIRDPIGRLDEAQETPTGGKCDTRIYTYDEESNRTALTQRESPTELCATEGGKTEWHTYDTANRLTDPGITYETFGNITKLPTPDAGEFELASSYYVDNQVASQSQNGKTINYSYDPAGRTLEAISAGITAVSHYASPGNALTWTCEEEGKKECEEQKETKWTRNIPGVDGALDAIQSNAGTPVLQLHDLEGNIVATASLSETATELLTKYNSTEFGVPTSKEAPKYAWLGADGVASELPSSGTITQDGDTYVPQTGRPLQTESPTPPIPANAGTPFVSSLEPWVIEGIAKGAARQVAAAEAARKARENAGGSSECNIYTEGCAADPEHGKNEFGCSLKASWGVEVEVNVQFKCELTPSATQIEVEVWRVENGKYVEVLKGSEAWNSTRNVSYELGASSCNPGKWYRAWVYGRVWAYNVFVWSDAYVLQHNKQCYEQPDAIPPGESGVEGDETPQPPDD
jgi:streptogramin lyase